MSMCVAHIDIIISYPATHIDIIIFYLARAPSQQNLELSVHAIQLEGGGVGLGLLGYICRATATCSTGWVCLRDFHLTLLKANKLLVKIINTKTKLIDFLIHNNTFVNFKSISRTLYVLIFKSFVNHNIQRVILLTQQTMTSSSEQLYCQLTLDRLPAFVKISYFLF